MWGIDGRHCPRLTILLHFGNGRSVVDIIPDVVLPSSASSTLTKQSNSEDHPLCQDVHSKMLASSFPTERLSDGSTMFFPIGFH